MSLALPLGRLCKHYRKGDRQGREWQEIPTKMQVSSFKDIVITIPIKCNEIIGKHADWIHGDFYFLLLIVYNWLLT